MNLESCSDCLHALNTIYHLLYISEYPELVVLDLKAEWL